MSSYVQVTGTVAYKAAYKKSGKFVMVINARTDDEPALAIRPVKTHQFTAWAQHDVGDAITVKYKDSLQGGTSHKMWAVVG